MRRGRKALGVAACVGILCSQPLFAQDTGFYAGGALGQAKLKEWCSVSPSAVLSACEDTDTAWKFLGGYRFNRYFGLEASYTNWGKTTGTVNGINASAEQSSLGIAAVGSFEFTPSFAVFGKAGYLSTEQETRGTRTVKRDETELHYGLGVRFAFAPRWAARAEWEKTDELEVEMLSLGVEYRF